MRLLDSVMPFTVTTSLIATKTPAIWVAITFILWEGCTRLMRNDYSNNTVMGIQVV